MISPILPYNINNSCKPDFKGAKTVNAIPIKHRGEELPQNLAGKFMEKVKNIFFEMFPKLDPKYSELLKK